MRKSSMRRLARSRLLCFIVWESGLSLAFLLFHLLCTCAIECIGALECGGVQINAGSSSFHAWSLLCASTKLPLTLIQDEWGHISSECQAWYTTKIKNPKERERTKMRYSSLSPPTAWRSPSMRNALSASASRSQTKRTTYTSTTARLAVYVS